MEEFYQDPTIIQEFLTESEELLQSMDQDLVQLESSPENEELLNRIFRALHTIKGTSGFLGFDPIVQLGHRAEDVLSALRRHDFLVSRRIMDALLATRDQLGRMLGDLRGGGLKPKYAIDHLITELEQVQKVDASLLPDKSQSQEIALAPEQEPVTAADTSESTLPEESCSNFADHAG
jgi:two-component system chemotaxis sensor kinase CheA